MTVEAHNQLARRSPPLFALCAWGLLALLAAPVWLGVVAAPRAGWRWAIARGASRLFFRALGVPVTLTGRAHLRHCPPCVIVANHGSWADPMILLAALPVRFAFTPSRAFTHNPLVRVFMARLCSLFVGGEERRGDAARLVALVRRGRSIVVFPEGVVCAEPGIRPFRAGAFVAARQAGVPVVPVVIHGSRVLFQHRRYVPRWTPVRVVILPPIPAGDSVEALRDAARAAILEEAPEPALEPPARPSSLPIR